MNKEDGKIEALLSGYRPAGPARELRTRILGLSERKRRWGAGGLKWAAVVLLLFSVGLGEMARRVDRETATMLGADRIEWTAEAEEIAEMLDGDGQGRRYVELALRADRRRIEPWPIQAYHYGVSNEL